MSMIESGTSSELRRANVRHLLGLIREHGPVSRSNLGRLSKLSKPTVHAVIEDLLKADLVLESNERAAEPTSRRGPMPRRVRFNSNHALVVGVDVGAAKILALLSNLDGDVLAQARCPTPADASGRRLDQAVKGLIDDCLEQVGIGRGRLAVATVGTPGLVDPATGSVSFAPQLPGWQGRAVGPILEESLGVPVLVESEAHLAMLGESWQGVAKGVTEAVFVQLGVGVGMGILIGGEIYRGAAGAAGEIGYLPIGEEQTDGEEGVFEAAVGSASLTRHLSNTAAQGKQTAEAIGGGLRSSPDGVGPAEIFARANENDEAKSVVDSMLGHLANGLIAVSAVLNPELIVLGGGLATSLGPYIARLEHELRSKVLKAPRVERSVLGDTAVAVGAIKRGVTFVEAGLFDSGNLHNSGKRSS
jgi:predicted NBD/HSP70 family sugar kinase